VVSRLRRGGGGGRRFWGGMGGEGFLSLQILFFLENGKITSTKKSTGKENHLLAGLEGAKIVRFPCFQGQRKGAASEKKGKDVLLQRRREKGPRRETKRGATHHKEKLERKQRVSSLVRRILAAKRREKGKRRSFLCERGEERGGNPPGGKKHARGQLVTLTQERDVSRSRRTLEGGKLTGEEQRERPWVRGSSSEQLKTEKDEKLLCLHHDGERAKKIPAGKKTQS